MGQYTRCKSVSNHGRTCHTPEIRYGTTVGGKPGGWLMQGLTSSTAGRTKGSTEWCKQLFPTTSIIRATAKYTVTFLVFLILKVS